jgi:hypothetical protein
MESSLPQAAIEGVRPMRDGGFAQVLITNQLGIARGYCDAATLERIHDRLQSTPTGGNLLLPARTLKRLRLPQARHRELVRKAMRRFGISRRAGRGHRGTAALTGGGGRDRVRMAPRAGPPLRRGARFP